MAVCLAMLMAIAGLVGMGTAQAEPKTKQPLKLSSGSAASVGAITVKREVTDWKWVAAGGREEAVVQCAEGVPVSGGEDNNSVGGIRLTRSYPSKSSPPRGPIDLWVVEVRNTFAYGGYFRGNAMCASGLKSKPEYVYGDMVNVEPGGARSSTAKCPGSLHVLGGGQWISGPPIVDMYSEAPYVEGITSYFEATGINRGSQLIGLQAVAVCADVDNYDQRGAVSDLPSGRTVQATASCPDGLVAVGGGGRVALLPSMLTDFYPSSASSWSTYGYNPSTEATWVSALVVCIA